MTEYEKKLKRKETIKAIVLLLLMCLTFIGAFSAIAFGIKFAVFAFKNPELTRTQVWVHCWNNFKVLRNLTLTGIGSYLVMFSIKNK